MEEATTELVRAKRIEIVDDDGVVRAVMGVDAKYGLDVAFISLHSPDESEHLTLYCDPERAGLELWEHGNAVFSASSGRAGDVSLSFTDPLAQEPVEVVGAQGSLIESATTRKRGTVTWSVRRWGPKE